MTLEVASNLVNHYENLLHFARINVIFLEALVAISFITYVISTASMVLILPKNGRFLLKLHSVLGVPLKLEATFSFK